MNQSFKYILSIGTVAIVTAACTEDTGEMGVHDTVDAIETSTASFLCHTSSIALDSVRSCSDKCYLGQIVDPETGALLKADFAAQFHTYGTGLLPPLSRIVKDDDGNLVCDSVALRLFFQKYYGDERAPFKLSVHELSMTEERMLREDSVYYTNVNLSGFVATPEEMASRKGLPANVSWPLEKVFTAKDYTESDSALSSSTHYDNVHIMLPQAYGRRILNLYRTNPEFFSSSYSFIRNVCPGFYFHMVDGSGAMLYVDVSAMDLYYRYLASNNKDTVQGVCRFAATGEVIQATHFEGGNNEALINDASCTYLKSPAGIGTLVTLPVDEIFAGHENDSIALASLHLTRYNVQGGQEYSLSPCQSIAMIERSELGRFFEKGYVRNARAYAVATLSSSYNLYSFSNIGRLVAYLYEKKRNRAQELCGGDTAAYARLHPEWNQVVLAPVTVTSNSSNQVVNISNDMSITSTRLVGGRYNPIQMQVIYSSYRK